MNNFEQNVQSKRNDAIDSGVGFIVSFGFSQHFSLLPLLLNLSVPKDCHFMAVFFHLVCVSSYVILLVKVPFPPLKHRK